MKGKFSVQSIVSFFKKRKAVGSVEHSLINPNRDWTIVVASNLVLLLAMIFFGTYTFITTQFVTPSETDMKPPSHSVDETSLNESLEYFDTQRAQYTDILEFPENIVDPFE